MRCCSSRPNTAIDPGVLKNAIDIASRPWATRSPASPLQSSALGATGTALAQCIAQRLAYSMCRPGRRKVRRFRTI